jgi:hypothetical protein
MEMAQILLERHPLQFANNAECLTARGTSACAGIKPAQAQRHELLDKLHVDETSCVKELRGRIKKL